jgi:uncharacterized membrane protein
MRKLRRMTLASMALILATLALGAPAFAQDSADVALDSPIRTILLDPRETRVDLDIDMFNVADERRIITFELIDLPEGWDIGIWNAFFDFKISELVVEPTENTPGQRPRMRIRLPDPRPEPGDYSFTLILADAANPNIEYDRAKFTIGVPEGVAVDAKGIEVRAELPALLGPANTSYEFEVIIKNDTDDRESFELGANVYSVADVERALDASDGGALDFSTLTPLQGWSLGFSPAFGEQKRISSVAIAAAVDERINVQVTPPLFVAPNDYLIVANITNSDLGIAEEQPLFLQITGRGELITSTTSGLLSMDATAGEETSNTMRFTNFGTGDLTGVDLSADAPPQWIVDFQIDRIETLPVNQQIDVIIKVTPPDDTIPGDYEITLRGLSQDATDSVVLRVTVDQSTIWGWLGIVLVLVVLGSLMGLFWKLGRR